MSIPEVIKEDKLKSESVFLRTVVKKEVYEQLRNIAQLYSTGQGHWDFGVAIQILLDNYNDSKTQSINDKLDLLIDCFKQQDEEVPKQEEYIEMLGGSKIQKESE